MSARTQTINGSLPYPTVKFFDRELLVEVGVWLNAVSIFAKIFKKPSASRTMQIDNSGRGSVLAVLLLQICSLSK